MQVKSVHVTIAGQVQGVGYRAWTEREARRRGLSGWVCNRRNGSVEAVFTGEAATVDAMVAACRSGPARARVTGLVATDVEATGSGGFLVRPTY